MHISHKSTACCAQSVGSCLTRPVDRPCQGQVEQALRLASTWHSTLAIPAALDTALSGNSERNCSGQQRVHSCSARPTCPGGLRWGHLQHSTAHLPAPWHAAGFLTYQKPACRPAVHGCSHPLQGSSLASFFAAFPSHCRVPSPASQQSCTLSHACYRQPFSTPCKTVA